MFIYIYIIIYIIGHKTMRGYDRDAKHRFRYSFVFIVSKDHATFLLLVGALVTLRSAGAPNNRSLLN